jgi:hypothetical protein
MNLLCNLNSEDQIIITSVGVTIGGILLGASSGIPQLFGITTLIVMTILVLGWMVTHGTRLGWLLPFGLVAGILELWADWIHVEYLGSLVYTDYFGFSLLASPSYMPLAWAFTVVQFGYLTLRLNERWPRWVATSIVTLLGMTLPPWYEEFAEPARAWHYTTTNLMLSHTPVWIIFTYGGCMFSIATMALWFYGPQAWTRAVLGGIFTGAGILLSGVIWFSVLA